VFEGTLGVLLEDVLDLARPVDDGQLEELRLVLARGLLAGCDIIRRLGKEGSALNLTNSYVGVSQENMELVHQILGDQVGPPHHVQGVAEDWQVNLVTYQV
jgi:hypothetical protein